MHVPLPASLPTWLQGGPQNLNGGLLLMLLIQPNCPGCHIHAIPVANKVAARKVDDLSCYCVSTAFEDFEFNHVESARMLVQEGKLVGLAAQRLGKSAPHIPTMPMAHDVVVDKADADPDIVTKALEATKQNARDQLQGRLPPSILEAELEKVTDAVLPEKIATLFWTVQAAGTPTWVLHSSSGSVFGTKFGQLSESQVLEWIEEVKQNHDT